MKEMNLSVSVKRACRTTRSLQGDKPWSNLLQPLEVCHRDQVWVADITYVRLNRRFIYVAVLMDVFTRMIRGWNLGQHLSQALTLKPLEQALHAKRPGDPSFRSRRAISFKGVSLAAQSTRD